MSEPPTRTMLDRYELLALIARGGMGSVHLARLAGAGGFQRLYAIKRMHPHLADEPAFVAMLLDEARLAARIHHTNAVAVVDVCEHEEGPFVVMDYIDGVTLDRLLRATVDLPWRERVRLALRVVCDALAGLHAAHDLTDDEGQPLGLVHRDVSPQNILVGTDGVGRITDFGIAVAASRIAASNPGVLKGKPAYMSPEQVSGEPIDRRSDLFSMGVLLWEAMAGQRLFLRESEATALIAVLSAEIPSLRALVPEVPEGLAGVCAQALARPREARFADARTMLRALEGAATAAGLLASTHDVADAVAAHCRDELDTRRARLRDATRTPAAGTLAPGGTGSRGAPRSDSRSIPAIEVRSHPGLAPTPAVVSTGVTDTSPPHVRRRLPLGLGALALTALAAWALRRPAAAPSPPETTRPTPVAARIFHEQVPGSSPAPAPQGPGLVLDAGAATAAAPDAAPVQPARAGSRVTRVLRSPSPAVPAATRAPAEPTAPPPPTTPPVEANPYLRP